MKKLVSFVVVSWCIFLVLLSCGGAGSGGSGGGSATTPTNNPSGNPAGDPDPSPNPDPNPNPDPTPTNGWLGLPAFTIEPLESKVLETGTDPAQGQVANFMIDTTELGDPCYKTEAGVKLLNNEAITLKAQLSASARPILCMLNSLDQNFNAARLIGDASEHPVLDANHQPILYYVYAPDSTTSGGVSYTSLTLKSSTKVPNLAMLWSKQPKRLLMFKLVDSPLQDKKIFHYLEAYQEGDSFHFLTSVLEGESFSNPKQGVRLQLSFNAALSRFKALKGYKLLNPNGQEFNSDTVLKGSLLTDHAGMFQVSTFQPGILHYGNYREYYWLFGNFLDPFARLSFLNFTNYMDDTPAGIVDSRRIENPDGSLKAFNEIVTLKYLMQLGLPSFTEELYIK